MAVGCGVILSLQESLARDFKAVLVNSASLCRFMPRTSHFWCVLAAISRQREEL